MFGPRVYPFVLCLLLAGCQSHPANQSNDDVDEHCPKVLEESRAVGIDYVPTLRRAAKGDDASLSQLFRLTGSDHLDADAQQCHIEALAELLERLGDVAFASDLENESPDVRRAVVNGLVIELESLPTAEQSQKAFADRYPRTAATLSP